MVEAGPTGVEVHDLTDDSRRVSPGSLFIARGRAGAGFIGAAVDAGAVAVLAEQGIDVPVGITAIRPASDQVVVNQALAGALAERFFDHPGRKLRLVGITGTNGKTTTAFMTQHLLRRAGVKCGLLGTVLVDDGASDGPQAAQLTTPGAIEFSRTLSRMVEHGCKAAVAEVSSHALEQRRTDAVRFEVAVFTNLSGDHLDYHQTMQNYAAAKARLFAQLPATSWAVVNHDDEWTDTVLDACAAKVMRTTFAESADADRPVNCRVAALQLTASASRARFDGPWGSFETTLPLIGRHNLANALQATAAAYAMTNLSGRELRSALETSPPVPGRLEPVRPNVSAKEPVSYPNVLVDYAHTDAALDNVLASVRALVKGRLVVVFGCGGDRDRTKRPRMAEAACRYGDRVYLTSDNPRTEDPDAIITDAQAGVPAAGRDKVEVEPDRAAAIRRAILAADDTDVVVIAGKGHEDYQIIGTQKRPFDDRTHAAAALDAWMQERSTECRLSI